MSTLPNLYVTRPLPDEVMRVIGAEFRLTAPPETSRPERKALLAGVGEAEAVICTLAERIDGELLSAASRLRIIANYAVGYDNIAVAEARARGVIVTNTPDVLTEATADLTWALLLATARRLPEGDALVRCGDWRGWEPTQMLGADVYGRTLGLIGMGRIGRAVARRAVGFTMPLLYYSRSPLGVAEQDRHWTAVPFDEVLTRSDFVSLHLPLTPQTHHLIGASALRRMRPTAYLINTSRGPVVDEAALVEAIREGRIAGAGLDVYEREPDLHVGLRELRQVVTLPHLGSATQRTRIRMGMVCLDNIRAVLAGKPPLNPVG